MNNPPSLLPPREESPTPAAEVASLTGSDNETLYENYGEGEGLGSWDPNEDEVELVYDPVKNKWVVPETAPTDYVPPPYVPVVEPERLPDHPLLAARKNTGANVLLVVMNFSSAVR